MSKDNGGDISPNVDKRYKTEASMLSNRLAEELRNKAVTWNIAVGQNNCAVLLEAVIAKVIVSISLGCSDPIRFILDVHANSIVNCSIMMQDITVKRVLKAYIEEEPK